MSYKNTTTTYGSVSKFFHWLIFLLVFFMLIYGFFMGDVPKEYKPLVFNTHKLLGVTILSLMILRLLWALMNPKPILPGLARRWERYAERTLHFLLYLALIVMPLSGWIGSSAAGKAPYLGDLTLSLPVEQNKNIVESSFNIHDNLAIIIIVLICLHVLAALYHHIVKKDEVLRRMMPNVRHR